MVLWALSNVLGLYIDISQLVTKFLSISFAGMPPPMQPPPFIRPDVQAAPPVMPPDEPAAKKSKIDAGPEANLIPENIFLQSHKGSVKFQVQVPEIPDKTEWKCQGQKIFLTLPWTDPVRD